MNRPRAEPYRIKTIEPRRQVQPTDGLVYRGRGQG